MKGIVDAIQFQKALSDVYKGAAPDSSLPALGTAKAEFSLHQKIPPMSC